MRHKILSLTLTMLAFFMTMPAQAATTPKREHRAAWVTTAWRMDWPTSYGTSASVAESQQAEAIEYLDLMKENGFNAVYLQVRGMSDAMYKSSYEPWSSYLTGTRGSAPTYDPLTFWVSECHKRGMECFAWVNPYRYESSISGATWTNGYRTTNPDWLMEYNNASILNPGIAAVRARIIDVCREIVSNYDVDGLVFDDYFYLSGTPLSQDQALYKASGSSKSQADWRRENVNKMVSGVYNMIQQTKPYVKFGIAPAGVAKASAATYGLSTSSISSASDWQYDDIYSDPLAWLGAGTVDFISPQLYWITTHSTNGYAKLSKWWSDACAGTFNRHFYSSHSISFLYSANTTSNWAEVAQQIQYNRDYTGNDAPGCVLFASRDFTGKRTSGLAPYLKSNKFQNIALPPTMTWKSRQLSASATVSNITLSGTTLSWNGQTNVRYAVYAVPNGTTPGSDVASNYLISAPYETSASVSGYTSGYQLGVSIVDRNGYEYPVSWLGGGTTTPTPELSMVTINTPANGSTVEKGFSFGWTALSESGVTYTLEISKSSTFSSTAFSASTSGTSYSSSNFALTEGTTYYWRVKASKSGYTGSTSWVGSFTVATTSGGGGNTSGLVKDDSYYETVDGKTIESQWIYSANTSNFPSNLTGTNRGMAALNGKVYVSQQGGALLEFDGTTGSLIRTINLTGDCLTSSSGSSLSYISNDVFVDGAGHLCVSNMTINTTTQPLTICTVNVSTGATTRVFQMSLHSTQERIDYAAAYGDVTASGGQIWAAVSTSNTVYRWTRNSSGTWTEAKTTINNYYSAANGATNNSSAPRIMPISTTQFVLDGHNSAPSLFTFKASGSATLNSSFESNTALAPSADNWNGICSANLAGTPIFVYVSSIAPNQFNIVSNPSNWSFSAMKKLWTVPASGLGSNANQCVSSQPAAINNADGSVTLYLYTPENGLACYLLKSETIATPDLESVTLNNPIGGTTVNQGFSFSWSSISSATYTLEVSTSSSFGSIAFSANTSSNSYSSSNFSLTPGATYYWRVKAEKSGYNSSVSSVGSFFLAQPTLGSVSLTYPTNGTTVSNDGFTFQWSAVSGASYVIEISTLATFNTVMFSAETSVNSIASSTFDLAEHTTYYWRVKAEKSGSVSSTSSVASFYIPQVTPDVPDVPETPSGLPTDGGTYVEKDGLRIKNLWIYSLQTNNFPSELGRDQRAMAAYNGNVYISERRDGAGYLLEFSGTTGEYLRTIALSGDYATLSSGATLGYLCNNIFTDDAGHLCVSNMIASVSTSGQLTVCTIDINTGATKRVFQSAMSNMSMRIDNCDVYGDITKAGSKVWAAASAGSGNSRYRKRIYCWTRESASGNAINDWSTANYNNAADFYPENASNFGNAPRVLPIGENDIIVDGSLTYPTRYTYTPSGYTPEITSSFEYNSNACPTGFMNAGMCTGKVMNKNLFIYSFNDNETEFFNFAIANNPSNFNFADFEIYWKVPQYGLGNVGNTFVSAIPATVNNADGSMTLFIYVPNNGLAAYLISDATVTDVEETIAAEALKVRMDGRVARFTETAETIKVYSAAGALVAYGENDAEIDLSSLSTGVYIIDAENDNNSIVERIVIK